MPPVKSAPVSSSAGSALVDAALSNKPDTATAATGSSLTKTASPTALLWKPLSELAPNPAPPAIFARVDPNMPEGAIVLGKDPWEHYAQIAENANIHGEIVAVVKRYETDSATGEVGERHVIVLRAIKPVTCQKDYTDPDVTPRGKLVKERVDGEEKTRDVYEIEPGTLFATNLRTIMKPAIPFAKKTQAAALILNVGKRSKLKSNAKLTYWEMTMGLLPLGHLRDTSLDGMSKEADEAQGYDAPIADAEIELGVPPAPVASRLAIRGKAPPSRRSGNRL